ncbi:MAG: hypothetical protein KAX49_07240 [Halanaerobiales bacterium]|nr:hypothetical protein [Halanaerobiales bacterium]
MLKNYTKQTITWNSKTNTGYGNGFAASVTVENVYIEKSLMLNRGTDDTTKSDAWFLSLEDLSFKVGDKITMKNQEYVITGTNTYYKQRGTAFKHIEVTMKEVF